MAIRISREEPQEASRRAQIVSLPKKRKYKLKRFTERVPEDFLCNKCSDVVDMPVECPRCGSLFCSKCIDPLPLSLSNKKVSQICTCCQFHSIPRPPSRVLRKIIGELLIRCKYSGCSEVVSLSKLESHQAHCPHKLISCGNRRTCSNRGLIRDFLSMPSGVLRYIFGDCIYICSQKCQQVVAFHCSVLRKDKKTVLECYHSILTASHDNYHIN